MHASNNTQVTINYSFKTTEGKVLGSSEQSGPLSFILGRGDVIQGLDSRIEGAKIGDHLSFVVPSEEAYGKRKDDLIFTIPRDRFKDIENIEIGTRVQSTLHGRPTEMTVIKLNNEEVTLDANHPLSGIDIAFEIDVTMIEEVPEELLQSSNGCGCGGNCGCGAH